MGVLKIRGHHAEEPGNCDPGADPGSVPDRAGEHHEMGSGPGLFLYPGGPGGRCPAQKAPGGIPGQRQQGIYVPEIKREIIKSWDRLFDARVDMGNPDCYGNIWEIKKEWITDVLR